MKKHLITILCLLAALACYIFGVPAGGALFVVLGIVLEGIFWVRLLRRSGTKS
ncbi:hypothetical protein [Microbulbifer magnicolonia]|uniref:hypothetical protein n=1 Tax=Microbulbifer magnicolonia TaxID=3109744 RepID=UPI002B40BAD0|nr:hypothetical protein [Microbulbifer sp. GG15]